MAHFITLTGVHKESYRINVDHIVVYHRDPEDTSTLVRMDTRCHEDIEEVFVIIETPQAIDRLIGHGF